jgi:hypothetical protein
MSKFRVLATIPQFAAELRMSPNVLRLAVQESGAHPVDRRGGHPVYALFDIHRAIVTQHETLSPHSQLAKARALLAEDELRLRRGQLCEADDVAAVYAGLVKSAAQSYETIPDRVEREVGLNGKQAAALERVLDEAREELYREVTYEPHSRTAPNGREGEKRIDGAGSAANRSATNRRIRQSRETATAT